MKPAIQNALFAAVMKLLRPLTRILLRNGIPYRTFADLARWVYVDVASDEFGIEGKKQTDSRVSIITGLSRKEVRRLKKMDFPTDEEALFRYNRAARVIAGWVKDKRFVDAREKPKDLSISNGRSSFSELVKLYGGDVPVRAVLDELMDVSALQMLDNGKIRLLAESYIPAGDEPTMLSILGADTAYLIETIDHNIFHPDDRRFFQRKVAYDNLSAEASEKFRQLSAGKAQKLLGLLDRWLAKHDRDLNPDARGTGRMKAGLGIYYFEEVLGEGNPDKTGHGGKS